MTRYGRRDFTRNVALATLFSPFVSILDGRPRARAAAGKAKYLLVIMANGTDMNQWPSVGSSPNAIKFSNMTAPLAPIKDNLILADNIDSRDTAAGHAAPGALSGKRYGAAKVSIDQFVSQKLIESGVKVQIPGLVLGGTASGAHKVFFRDGKEVTPIYSATSAFETVFGATAPVPPGGGGGGGANPLAAQLARRQSILDALRGDLKQLSAALGAPERAKLDLYADSIRQLEERIKQQSMPIDGGDAGGGGGGQCTTPAPPASGAQDVVNSSLHLDIVANAFACDLTRVAAVAFGNDQSCQVDLRQEVGAPGDWHSNFTHGDSGDRTRMQNLERWICGEIVRLCNKLKSLKAPTGGGTLFDQTLIMWARDMGDAVVHNGTNMPFMFAGGAGGYLRKSAGGVYVNGGGEFHQRALLNCAEAMGITDFTGFGETDAGGDSRLPLPAIGG